MSYNNGAMALLVRESEPPATNPPLEIAQLIDRYPDLSEPELEHLIGVFPHLPAVDVALMMSDEDLAPRLDAFCRDHKSTIRTPFRQYAALVVIAVVGTAIVLLALMVGS